MKSKFNEFEAKFMTLLTTKIHISIVTLFVIVAVALWMGLAIESMTIWRMLGYFDPICKMYLWP
jgi:hypothetical protein